MRLIAHGSHALDNIIHTMASPASSSPAPPKPPKPPPIPLPRVSSSPIPSVPSIGSPSGPNQMLLPDDVEQPSLPRASATRPPSSHSQSLTPNTSSGRTAPRISTANAIAATKDIKKRWCGAHDAAANGDLMRLKSYIDASDGSPKRNVMPQLQYHNAAMHDRCCSITTRNCVPR